MRQHVSFTIDPLVVVSVVGNTCSRVPVDFVVRTVEIPHYDTETTD